MKLSVPAASASATPAPRFELCADITPDRSSCEKFCWLTLLLIPSIDSLCDSSNMLMFPPAL